MVTLHLAQQPDADAFLVADPLGLLIGMLLDQQVGMEKAFSGPYELARRMAVERLDAEAVAAFDPEQFGTLFATPPALHRFPGAMAKRTQALAEMVRDRYDGDAASVWTGATSGADLLARLGELPGFGAQKAKIFLALLGKQLGVRPEGWREAAGEYGVDGSTRSVADVTGPETLQAVREHKRAAKAEAAAKAEEGSGAPSPKRGGGRKGR